MLLKRLLPSKELGYTEKGEEFTRYTLLKTRWFNVYLHRLRCPNNVDFCHDHPWRFWAFLLIGGYKEELNGAPARWRYPGSVLYRPETCKHNVWTGDRTNWSIIVTGPKMREWGFQECGRPETYRTFEVSYKPEWTKWESTKDF